MGTWIVSALLVLMVAGIVRHLVRQRRQGKSPCGCGGGCSGCCGGCAAPPGDDGGPSPGP